MEEIIEMRDNNPERYKKNNMRPIDAIDKLYGLSLTIFLHFQNPDEILGNRDDDLYSHKLRSLNNGKTFIFTGFDGGHNTFHTSLWNFIKKINL